MTTEAATTTATTPAATVTEAPVDPAVNATNGGAGTSTQPAPTEVAAETPAQAKAEGEPDSREIDYNERFQALAKREHAAVQKEREAKEAKARAKEIEQKFERIQTDPFAVLAEAGFSWEDLVNIKLNDGKLPAERKLKLLEEQREREIAAREEEQTQAQREAEETAVASFKKKIRETVTSSEEFELIAVNEAFDLVYNVVDQTYAETGRIIPIEEAARKVEAELEEIVTGRILKAKKIAARLQPLPSGEPQTDPEAKPAENPAAPTLTNRGTSAATPPAQPSLHLDREQRVQAAIDVLRKARAQQSA